MKGLILAALMVGEMLGQGMQKPPTKAIASDTHTLTEIEQLKLSKADAEMQTMQLQFAQVKQAETQLQVAYAEKQGELETDKKAIFKRLNIEEGGLFQIVKEGKEWKVVAIAKPTPPAAAAAKKDSK